MQRQSTSSLPTIQDMIAYLEKWGGPCPIKDQTLTREEQALIACMYAEIKQSFLVKGVN